MTSTKLKFLDKLRNTYRSNNFISLVVTDNLLQRLIFIFWCVFIIAFREIHILITPRLWAEEGKIFYSFARHHSLIEIFTAVHTDYLTLFNSIVSTLQAKIFPIEAAAAVSTYLGFLVQLIPIIIIVFTTHIFWASPFKKIICLMIIILTAPELWLNTSGSHFIFGLITFLILVIPSDQLSPAKKWIFRMLLILGTLSGPTSMLLTPVFFLKSYMEKTKEKIIQTIIVTICSIIQLIIIIYSFLHNVHNSRLSQYDFYQTIYNFFIDHFSLNLRALTKPGMIFFGMLIAVYFIYLIIKNWKNNEYRLFFISFLLVAFFSTLGSLQMAGSPRYGYVSTCILMIVIVQEVLYWMNNKEKKWHTLGAVIFLFCFTLNVIYYKTRMQEVTAPDYPRWKYEVAKWRINNNYAPRIHPKKDIWFVDL